MKQLISISRNLSLQIHESDKKGENKVTETAEIIIAHTDGKRYEMNEAGETHRKTRIKESRFHVDHESIKGLIKYLQKVQKELEEWEDE